MALALVLTVAVTIERRDHIQYTAANPTHPNRHINMYTDAPKCIWTLNVIISMH